MNDLVGMLITVGIAAMFVILTATYILEVYIKPDLRRSIDRADQ